MKKILIIRFSSIGDLVLTTPVIRALSKQLADAELHFLTKKRFIGILEHNPYLNKIHSFVDAIQEVIPDLQAEKFDLIIDLHKNLRSKLVISKLGVKNLSFDKLNMEKWLLVNLKADRLPKKHLIDRYFDALKPLSIENDLLGLDYFEGEENKEITTLLPESFLNGYVVFALAGTYFTKKVPFEKWREMAKNSPYPILLLGGKTEIELATELQNIELRQSIYNGCGSFSLNQSAAFIRHAQLVISGDTGLMHIAAAYKKRIVSIWGNTVPEFGMYPYLPQDQDKSLVIENKELNCRPCSKLGYKKCPKGHFKCMMDLDVSNVFRQI